MSKEMTCIYPSPLTLHTNQVAGDWTQELKELLIKPGQQAQPFTDACSTTPATPASCKPRGSVSTPSPPRCAHSSAHSLSLLSPAQGKGDPAQGSSCAISTADGSTGNSCNDLLVVDSGQSSALFNSPPHTTDPPSLLTTGSILAPPAVAELKRDTVRQGA